MSKAPVKRSIRLPGLLARQLAEHALAQRVSQAAVIEAALASHLSPDGPERLEAAFARRLDRLSRQLDRLQWHADLTNETLALFIRFWLTAHAPPPDGTTRAAQAAGKERWERFVESLGRRMELGPRLREELSIDRDAASAPGT